MTTPVEASHAVSPSLSPHPPYLYVRCLCLLAHDRLPSPSLSLSPFLTLYRLLAAPHLCRVTRLTDISLSVSALSPCCLSTSPYFRALGCVVCPALPVPARPASRWRCVPLARPPARRRSPAACKRKEQEQQKERALQPKKQRLVFTDLQRRTLIAIFKENKRPSKEMQVTISQQLGLELNTVSNFFMNARRRCMNRWAEEPGAAPGGPAGAATFSKA